MIYKVKIIFALFFLINGLKLKAEDILQMLPGLDELPGWQLNRPPQVYEGEDLFGLINGGADLYLEYGFIRVVSAQYTDPSQNIILSEIYEMTDDASAYGIFSINQQKETWSEGFGNLGTVNSNYISFWKGRYFVNISWTSRQHIEKPNLEKLAGLIDRKIKEPGTVPNIVRTFGADEAGVNFVYLKGNLSLSNFYYFDFKDVFQIREGIAWSDKGFHQIIFRYDDEAKAAEAAGISKEYLSGNKRFSDVINTFQGFRCVDNKGSQIILRQVGNFIVVLVGIDSEVSLGPLMDQASRQIEKIADQ